MIIIGAQNVSNIKGERSFFYLYLFIYSFFKVGSPVTATCAGVVSNPRQHVKWGSAGKQVPGSRICVLKEDTLEETTLPNQFGNIVLKLPLPPAAFPRLWNNPEGYKASYFDKYPGYFDTGDAGMIDEEG